jgi:hypothetical protein
MRLVVNEGIFFQKDRATASEIVAQTERAVERHEPPRWSASRRGEARARNLRIDPARAVRR